MGARATIGVAIGVGLLSLACGQGSFSATDGGADATSDGGGAEAGVDAAADAPVEAGCNLPPNNVGAEGDFCDWYAAYTSRCGYCQDCVKQDVNGCIGIGGSLSDAMKKAMVACGSAVMCSNNLLDLLGDPCLRAQLRSVQRTPTQNDARSAYCAACKADAGVADCQSFFDLTSDAGGAGTGMIIMSVSDEIGSKINAACGTACDPTTYEVCAFFQYCGVAPHSSCATGTCK